MISETQKDFILHWSPTVRPGFHMTLTVGEFYCRWSFTSKIFCLSESFSSSVITDKKSVVSRRHMETRLKTTTTSSMNYDIWRPGLSEKKRQQELPPKSSGKRPRIAVGGSDNQLFCVTHLANIVFLYFFILIWTRSAKWIQPSPVLFVS